MKHEGKEKVSSGKKALSMISYLCVIDVNREATTRNTEYWGVIKKLKRRKTSMGYSYL